MSEPALARPAATILLLRDGPSGLETFMVVRHHHIDFASGALVFPGGRMEAADMEMAEAAIADRGGRGRRRARRRRRRGPRASISFGASGTGA